MKTTEPNQRLQTMRFTRPIEFDSPGPACLTRSVRQVGDFGIHAIDTTRKNHQPEPEIFVSRATIETGGRSREIRTISLRKKYKPSARRRKSISLKNEIESRRMNLYLTQKEKPQPPNQRLQTMPRRFPFQHLKSLARHV